MNNPPPPPPPPPKFKKTERERKKYVCSFANQRRISAPLGMETDDP